MRPFTKLAVRNNAEWCDAVCSARGLPGRFSEYLWISRRPPPYYPHVVTLQRSSASLRAALSEAVDQLRSEGGVKLTVKDSFADVNLAPLGFRVLFEARWFGRPGSTAAGGQSDGVRWAAIQSKDELLAWKRAWDMQILKIDPVFLSPLLDDENVLFMSAKRGGAIVSGAIVNRHAGVVGISNFFSRGPDAGARWSECVSLAMARFPGLPVVGYARSPELSDVLNSGFDSLGRLRVWIAT